MQPAIANGECEADFAFVGDGLVKIVRPIEHRVARAKAAALVRETARHDERVFAAGMCVPRNARARRDPVQFGLEARTGVQFMMSHTIKAAHGSDRVEGATVIQVDDSWQPIPGTEKSFEVDTICIAVGLNPMTQLLLMCMPSKSSTYCR